MIAKIIEDIERIQSQLNELTTDHNLPETQNSEVTFVTIEAKLRELVDIVLKLPIEDREALKDTIESFKNFIETKQQEAEKAVLMFKAKISASKNSKDAMKAYGALNK